MVTAGAELVGRVGVDGTAGVVGSVGVVMVVGAEATVLDVLPVAVMVWSPGRSGMVRVAVAVPNLLAVAVPNTTGSEFNMNVTVSSGTNPVAVTSITSPGSVVAGTPVIGAAAGVTSTVAVVVDAEWLVSPG